MNTLVLAMLFASQAATVGNQPGSISGRLLARDGRAAADARIVALAVDENPSAQALMSLARTDANGRYRLEDIPPGRYLIAAGSLDSPSYFPGVTTRAAAAVVVIKPGAALMGIDFLWVVIPPLRVSGRLIFESLSPSGNQTLRLTPVTVAGNPAGGAINLPGAFRNMNVGPDGWFEFQNVVPGAYQLSLARGGLDVPIVVEDRDVTGMELPVRGQVMVSQSVTVENDDPLPAIELLLTDLKFNAVPPIVRAGARSLTAPLWTGDYQIEVRGLPQGVFVKSMTSGSRDLRTQPLEVRGAGPQAEIAVTLGVASPPWVTLNGRVVGDGAAAVSQAIAVGKALQERMSTAVSKDGSFVFTKLLPGAYSISAVPGTEPLPAAVTVNVDAASASVELAVRTMKQVAGRVVQVTPIGPPPQSLGFDVSCPRAPGANEVSAKISVPIWTDGAFSLALPATGCRIALDRTSLRDHRIQQPLLYGAVELSGESLFTYADSTELKVTLAYGFAITGQLARIEPAVRRIVFRPQTMLLAPEGIQARIDAEGKFAVGLPSGTYWATLDAGTVIPIPDLTLTVNGGRPTSGFVIVAPPLRKVTVRALTEGGGRPPESFILSIGGRVAQGRHNANEPQGVQLESPTMEYHGNSAAITPSSDGTFPILLPEGSYWLLVEFPEDRANPPAVKSVSAGDVNLRSVVLTVAERDLEITVVFEAVPR